MIWLVIAGVAVGMVGAGIIVGKIIARPPNARLHDGSMMADDIDQWTGNTQAVER